jgi:plasmid maintenance system antidote protein VapI
MTNKKTTEQISGQEAVKSFVFPVALTEDQQKLAASQLAQARNRLRNGANASVKLAARLMQFRLQLENYLNQVSFDEHLRFGDFLKSYLDILGKRSNEFAHEISVHETLVSQLINNRRTPGENILIRLELHSNGNIPADYWLRLVEKESVHKIKKDKHLRIHEKNKVSNKILVKI